VKRKLLDNIRAFELHEYLDLSLDEFLVFDGLKRDRFDGQELRFIIFDIASIDDSEATLSKLNWGNNIVLDDFAIHWLFEDFYK
jgi:hypothetical protein